MKKRLSVFVLAFVLIFALSAPTVTQAASLHTSYYAHTIKTATYHYSPSGKSKVRGHIASHKTLRVNTYYKGWYKVIWGKRYVWVYKTYVAKGKYVAPLKFQYDAHTTNKTPYHSSSSAKSKILGHIAKNANLLVFKYSGGWYTIKWGNNYVFVNKKYVKKGEYIAPKLRGKVIQEKNDTLIILPDGGKIYEYADGSTYAPDPSQGGSKEPVALQVAQAQAIQLGTGNIVKNSNGSCTVLVPKYVVAAEAKKYGGKIITYSDGSYAISYPNLKKNKNGSFSYEDPTVRVEVEKYGSYTNIFANVIFPKGFADF